jgi:hypothetical protein
MMVMAVSCCCAGVVRDMRQGRKQQAASPAIGQPAAAIGTAAGGLRQNRSADVSAVAASRLWFVIGGREGGAGASEPAATLGVEGAFQGEQVDQRPP